MISEILLPALWGIALLIQLFFLLFVYTKLLKPTGDEELSEAKEGVSIVLAAWNELHNLKELLPLLENQNYPDFEIILVDDRSSDGTYDYLLNNEGNFSKLKFVRIEALPEHFTAKKYAVTMGIKKSSKDLILLTDADCRPSSPNWIAQMAARMTDDKEIVLGFSPYQKLKGKLNAFIRYETFQTALLYLSFAAARMPFMGVGRNLMYRKSAFWNANGFAKHLTLLSGDDDLFVNQIANKTNTAICIDEEASMVSEPKTNYQDWKIQKKRHLSVGKRYRLADKLLLGIHWVSLMICWFLPIVVFFANPSWFELFDWLKIPTEWLKPYGIAHYEPFNNWMRLTLVVFGSWFFLRWYLLHRVNKKLGKTLSGFKIMFADFVYILYLIIFGIITIFSNPQKIKWR